jgi:hypothetical protein
MKKLILFASIGSSLLAAPALAEDAPESVTELVNPATTNAMGAGVKVGEGTVIHPVIGIETGVVNNVFYEESGGNIEPNTAGLLRILAELSTGSLPTERTAITNRDATDPGEQALEAGKLQYLASAYLSWDQYLSTNDAVQDQGGLGGGVLFKGIANPRKPISFAFFEHFSRQIRAANFETADDTNRDVNQLALRLNYQPRGRSLGGYVYWRNLIDYFEDSDQQFVNRFQNTFGARVNWQWLPLTRIYVDANIGVYNQLGDEMSSLGTQKIDSVPIQAVAGIMTALSLNVTVNGRFGYTHGGYSSGPSYDTVTGGVQLGFRYSPRGRVTVMYNYDHQDSVNANFYRDHLLKLEINQQFVPFAVDLGGELHLRRYQGVTDVTGVVPLDGSNIRDDVIGAINAGARYMFREWFAAVATYQFSAIATDFEYDAGGGFIDDPSYLRHQLMVGVRAAY